MRQRERHGHGARAPGAEERGDVRAPRRNQQRDPRLGQVRGAGQQPRSGPGRQLVEIAGTDRAERIDERGTTRRATDQCTPP